MIIPHKSWIFRVFSTHFHTPNRESHLAFPPLAVDWGAGWKSRCLDDRMPSSSRSPRSTARRNEVICSFTRPGKHTKNDGKSPCLVGETTLNGQFSIAMLVYQRVSSSLLFLFWFHYTSIRLVHLMCVKTQAGATLPGLRYIFGVRWQLGYRHTNCRRSPADPDMRMGAPLRAGHSHPEHYYQDVRRERGAMHGVQDVQNTHLSFLNKLWLEAI
jgi:hypothetical protein